MCLTRHTSSTVDLCPALIKGTGCCHLCTTLKQSIHKFFQLSRSKIRNMTHKSYMKSNEMFMLKALTLDPNKTVEKVELATRVWPRPPVCPPDFIGLFGKTGVLSNFIQNMGWKGAISICLKNHT